MTHWMMWTIAAGMVVILELFTGTFYLLMIAIGIAAGALTAWLGMSDGVQYLTAAAVGIGATLALNRSKLGQGKAPRQNSEPATSLDIGQFIEVNQWTVHEDVSATARAMYRGAQWDIDFSGAEVPRAGRYRIIGMRGSRLLVAQESRPLH